MKAILRVFWLLFLFCGIAGAADSIPAPDSSVTVNYQEEILMRDSLLAAKESLAIDREAFLRAELESEQAKCKNWEESWNTLKEDHGKCSTALRVAIESQMQTGSQTNKSNMMMTTSSFLGGIILGFLVGWLAL
ncbi:MAG: hypothetical protein LBR60_09280 [Fibrobacter sp.]|jgi:hypothetical protein|nr:hypothetical protein [Fibrobacter sp.]